MNFNNININNLDPKSNIIIKFQQYFNLNPFSLLFTDELFTLLYEDIKTEDQVNNIRELKKHNLINQEFIDKINSSNKTCWHALFNNINNEYQAKVINELLEFLDIDYFNYKDGNEKLCWHYLFENVNNEHIYNVIKLIMEHLSKQRKNSPYILIPEWYRQFQDLCDALDNDGKTCLHYLFYKINNVYQYETIKLFKIIIIKEYLNEVDDDNKTCFTYLFENIDNEYRLKVVELFKDQIKPSDLIEKDDNLKTCWHYLFENINNSYTVEIIRLLSNLIYFPVDFTEMDYDGNCIWNYLFSNVTNKYQYDVIVAFHNFFNNLVLNQIDLDKKKFWSIFFENLDNEYQVKTFDLIHPFLYKYHLSSNYEGLPCLHYLFKKLNNYKIIIIKKLFHFLDFESLVKIDDTQRTCWHYLFENIDTEDKYNLFLFLLNNNFLTIDALRMKDEEQMTCWHYIFQSIKFEYNFDLINILKENDFFKYYCLEDVDINNMTCFHHFFNNLENKNQYLVFEKILLVYITEQNLSKRDINNYSCWHYLFNNLNSFRVMAIKQIITKLMQKSNFNFFTLQFDINTESVNPSLHNLFKNINDENSVELINFLLPFINNNTLTLKNSLDKTCLHILFSDIKNIHQVNIVRNLVKYINNNDLICRDLDSKTCLHYLLSYINNEHQVAVCKSLIPHITINELKICDEDNKICLYYLLKNFNNQYQLDIMNLFYFIINDDLFIENNLIEILFNDIQNEYQVKLIENLLLVVINKKTLSLQFSNNNTCWHYLFNSINQYKAKTIQLLLFLYDHNQMKLKNSENKTCWNYLFDSKRNDTINQVINFLEPFYKEIDYKNDNDRMEL